MSADEGRDAMTGAWLSPADFALHCGVTARAVRAAIKKALDRGEPPVVNGQALVVRAVPGRRGGRGGIAYEVQVKRPTGGARDPAPKGGTTPLAVAVVHPTEVDPAAVLRRLQRKASELAEKAGQASPKQVTLLRGVWRQAIVDEIIGATPTGTPGRGRLIRRLAEEVRFLFGDKSGELIGPSTLYSWVAKYEDQGLVGLASRRARADRGQRRVIAWRTWDAAMDQAGVPEAQQRAVAAQLEDRIRALYLSAHGISAARVRMLMAHHCRDAAVEAGLALDGADLDALCHPPLSFVARKELSREPKLEAMRRQDAGAFAARVTPRIRRPLPGPETMVLAGDVRHLDVLYRRADESLATPKAVSFLDVGTGRMFSRFFLLPKGEMIRRDHVLVTLRDVLADPGFGVPDTLYLDNGSEFLIGPGFDDLAALGRLLRGVAGEGRRPPGILRSRPYNAQAKFIEAHFARYARTVEPLLPGHIGGDRMAKKTERQGRPPVPMPGNEAEVIAQLERAEALFNASPYARGERRGLSPNDLYRNQVEAGRQALVVDPQDFELGFGKEERRQVMAGGRLILANEAYRHDALLTMVGEKVRLRVPLLGSGGRIVILDDKGDLICVAAREEAYGYADARGAREQRRREGQLRQALREGTRGLPRIDLGAEMDRALALRPAPVAPEPAATIKMHPFEIGQALDAPDPAERRRPPSKNRQTLAALEAVEASSALKSDAA